MPKTNAEIAAFRDPDRKRAGWWRTKDEKLIDDGNCVIGEKVLRVTEINPPIYTGPDRTTAVLTACAKALGVEEAG